MNKALLLLCSLGLVFTASAQKTFKYAAKVGPLDTPGFYTIILWPAFIAKSKADLSDIRLMDDSGHFVPFVLTHEDDVLRSASLDSAAPYVAFPIVSMGSPTDTGTTLVVKNVSRKPVGSLEIKLKNAAVDRTVNLYGSDDLKQWYAIEENVALGKAGPADNSDYAQTLPFPPSNYHYLKLVVNDKHKAPIKFLGVGIHDVQALALNYSELAGAKFVKRDSGKTTLVTISFDDNYLVNKIVVSVKSPKFYNRNVSIYDGSKPPDELLATESLRSGDAGAMLIDIKTNKLVLEIDNEDNPPLNVDKVQLFQADRTMLAYLEAGRRYQLLTGDNKAATPNYDLKFFTDSAKNHALRITHDPVVKNELYAAPATDHANERTIIIWAAILVALLLLSLLTWKMVGEVNKRDKADA